MEVDEPDRDRGAYGHGGGGRREGKEEVPARGGGALTRPYRLGVVGSGGSEDEKGSVAGAVGLRRGRGRPAGGRRSVCVLKDNCTHAGADLGAGVGLKPPLPRGPKLPGGL